MDEIQQALMNEIIAKTGIPILLGEAMMLKFHGPIAKGAHGCYMTPTVFQKECLFWVPELDYKRAVHVLMHELTHATMVKLNRPLHNSFYSKEYCIEEVIAETTAYRLMKHFGLETQHTADLSKVYLGQYAETLTPDELQHCELKSNEAFDFIMNNWLYDFERMLPNIRKAA